MKKKFILIIGMLITSWYGYSQTITRFAGVIIDGIFVDTFIGNGGPATNATFGDILPNAALDRDGNLYFTDERNNTIRKISTNGIIDLFGGTGELIHYWESGPIGDGNPVQSVRFNYLSGIAIDHAGNIFVSEPTYHVVRKISVNGTINTIAGTADSGYSGDGGAATTARLSRPTRLAVDPVGNLYIVDPDNFAIRKVDVNGIITTYAGNGIEGTAGDGGPATAANLTRFCSAIACDQVGNLYIGDTGRIRKVDASGIISTYAGGGAIDRTGILGNGGPATSAGLGGVASMACDLAGNLYFGNGYTTGFCIRKINSLGVITHYAGIIYTGTVVPSGLPTGDGGPATAAEMNGAAFMTSDSAGNVIFGDIGAFRKISTGNTAPYFNGGTSQTLSVCQNSGATSINSLLAVTDADAGQTETWTVTIPAAHGTVSAAYTTTSTGSSMTPTGLTYTPTTGYSGPDVFTVLVNDGSGGASTTVNVTVVAPAGSTTGSASLCVGSSTTFANSIAGGTWSSADPAIASVTTGGIVTGMAAGTTTISYTTGCGSVAAAALTVIALPATITGASNICMGSSATLGNATSGGTWSSSNPSAATVNSATGEVYPVASGTTTISYSNSCGHAVHPLTVNALPVISGTSITICNGSSGTLTVSGAADYSWSPATGLSATTGSDVIANPTATTTYTVTGTNPSGCDNTVTITIYVNSLPVISGSSITICSGSSGTLTASGGSTYTWSPGSGLSATTGASVVASPTTTSTYTVTGTALNGCINTGTAAVTVNPLPNAGIITGPGTQTCGIVTYTLTTSGDVGGVWASVNTSKATINSSTGAMGVVNHTRRSSFTDTFTYTVTNGCGSATASNIFTIMGLPGIHGGNDICVGSIVTYDCEPVGYGIGSWVLTTPATDSTWTTTDFQGKIKGIASSGGVTSATYRFICTGSATLCADTVYRNVRVNAPPTALITGSNTAIAGSIITLTSANSGTWTSSNTAAATVASGSTTNRAVYASSSIGASTIITLTRSTGGCTSATDTQMITIICSGCKPADEEGLIESRTLNIYPNPSPGSFIIECPPGPVSKTITITDVSGRIVATRISVKQREDFDLGNLSRGLYIITVETEEKKYKQKIVID